MDAGSLIDDNKNSFPTLNVNYLGSFKEKGKKEKN
jgi:hypothetical protein